MKKQIKQKHWTKARCYGTLKQPIPTIFHLQIIIRVKKSGCQAIEYYVKIVAFTL